MQGKNIITSILISVTMTALMTGCAADDIATSTTAAEGKQSAIVTERIPIILNASDVRAEVKAVSNTLPDQPIGVFCLPTAMLEGTQKTREIDMTQAVLPFFNRKATIGGASNVDKNGNAVSTLNWADSDSIYYYPQTTGTDDYRYAFYAYQPVLGDSCFVTADKDVYGVYKNLDGTNDILWSQAKDDSTQYAYSFTYWMTKPSSAAPVLQKFQHIMSAITVRTASDNEYRITNLKIGNVPTEGHLYLSSGMIVAADSYGAFNADIDGKQIDHTFYIVPMEYGQTEGDTLQLTLNYVDDNVAEGEDNNKEITLPLTNKAGKWERGKEYTITINIDDFITKDEEAE